MDAIRWMTLAIFMGLCATPLVAEDLDADELGCACQRCCGEGEPGSLFGGVGECLGLEIRAWMVAGFVANAHGNRTGMGNAPLGYNNVADGPVMNQLWVEIQKTVDTGGCGADWGFQVDYQFGADGPDNQAFGDQGWDFGWNSSRDYGSAILNANVSLGLNDLTVKFGKFQTFMGYEFSQTPDNFFYSHTLTWYYGEPNSHTGVMATYPVGEDIEVNAGWTMGWDSGFENYLGASTFLGNVTWTISDRALFYWAATVGDIGDGTAKNGAASNSGDVYLNSFVFEYQLTDALTYTFWHDFGINKMAGPDVEWYGVTQSAIYEFNPCLSVGARYEWYRDDDGARVFNNNGAGAGHYHDFTLTANWKPHPNVTLRPEIRWDWFDGMGQPYDPRGGVGTSSSMFTGGGALIVTF
jgi:hypothetical protein